MGFTLDGKSNKELGLGLIRGTEVPILPATRDRTLAIPGRHGEYDFGADLGPRLFQLECFFLNAKTPADIPAAARSLAAFLLDGDGRPRKMTLTFDNAPEKVYTVRYAGSPPVERLASFGSFSLSLIAYDPFARAEATAYDVIRQYDAGHLYDTGLMYPNPAGFSWIYARQRTSLYNYSSIAAPLKIIISGTVVNPTITNTTTGKQLMVSRALVNETVEIDAETYMVTAGGVNALAAMTGDFLTLAAGKNDLLFEGVSPNASVTLIWKHKFA